MTTLSTANTFGGVDTVGTLNGLFKEVYADKLKNLIPDGTVLMKQIPFVSKDKQMGDKYHQPVVVAMEHGFSYGGIGGTNFALADAIPGQVKDASLASYEFVLRTAISVGAISRSMNSAASFERATKLIIANMVRSFAKRLECILLYGQLDIGVVGSITGSGASRTLVLTTASWASGIWSGSVNMKVSIWDSSSSFAALDVLGFTVTGVDIVARSVTVLEGSSGTAATISTSDVLTHFGAGYYQETAGSNEFAGLQKIMANTGTLFGISATTYDLWRSVSYSAASAELSMTKINDAIALAVPKGLEEDVTVHVNPRTWSNLLSDEAALRRYGAESKDEMANGARRICFYGQNGKISIQSNIYVKESLAFIVPEEDCLLRVGSSDVTFDYPGRVNDQYLQAVPNMNAVEIRAYADMALFCAAPAKLVLITAIVNS